MQMKNNTAQATKVITAHVPLPMADKVDQMAARLERSRGWVIKQALSAWLAQEEERNRLTLEALDDVTSGQVIDHQAVQAWADSLSTDNPLPVPSPQTPGRRMQNWSVPA
ncbi:ribbon-helix-helix protein, CopG family [Escherichia coli]|nr:ribbon-helix-helix protein, CopG family [Escherichia coli]EEQ2578154.1 ribbon-helix-helix protein, CopG family [Escherichia coli]EER1731264.1 ribbon-helix-helix protein, CopG family [Escherichia coli]EEY7334978.1 ribbon-helix-helix protein, CopG family [Escherichia coli]EEZ1643532.1 ribbon-helix-helix protein, CopG family [Escherichia coli]